MKAPLDETPETDAAEVEIIPSRDPNYDGPHLWVEAHIARSLERRLQEAQRANLLLTASTTGLIQCVEKLERELAAQRENSRQWKLLAEMNAALVKACEEDAAIRDALAEKGKP